MPSRLLVINPNTTMAITDRFVAEARLVAPMGTTVDGITATTGVPVISTFAENAAAGIQMLEMLRGAWRGYDAVILAVSFDTALKAARCAVPVPVIGISEASLFAALRLYQPFGLLTYGTPSRPLYESLVSSYGLAGSVVGIETIEAELPSAYLLPSAEEARHAAARLQAKGAKGVVICGTALAGMASRWQPQHQIPLMDAIVPSIAAALHAVDNRRNR